MYWLEKLHKAQAELAERDADPLQENVEAIVCGMAAISTHSLPMLWRSGHRRRAGPQRSPPSTKSKRISQNEIGGAAVESSGRMRRGARLCLARA